MSVRLSRVLTVETVARGWAVTLTVCVPLAGRVNTVRTSRLPVHLTPAKTMESATMCLTTSSARM